MIFLKLSTMEYPRYEGDIRIEHPEIPDDQTGDNFPAVDDYAVVEQTPIPTYDPNTQYVTQTTPIQVDGTWQSVWEVVDLTADELAAIAAANAPPVRPVRKQRPSTNVSGSAPNVIT